MLIQTLQSLRRPWRPTLFVCWGRRLRPWSYAREQGLRSDRVRNHAL